MRHTPHNLHQFGSSKHTPEYLPAIQLMFKRLFLCPSQHRICRDLSSQFVLYQHHFVIFIFRHTLLLRSRNHIFVGLSSSRNTRFECCTKNSDLRIVNTQESRYQNVSASTAGPGLPALPSQCKHTQNAHGCTMHKVFKQGCC